MKLLEIDILGILQSVPKLVRPSRPCPYIQVPASPGIETSDPKNCIVGWICAITSEYVAAQAFLDEEHEGPESLSPHNKNDYTLGRTGRNNVVLSVLPLSSYGTSSAGRVAEDRLHSFPNIRIGLTVGIGGGAQI